MISTDELRELVVKGDRETLCCKMKDLSEQERSNLSAFALQLFQTVDNLGGPDIISGKAPPSEKTDLELLTSIQKIKHKDWRIPRLTAGLGLLGLCDLRSLQSYQGSWFRNDLHDMPQRVTQILNDRRVSWLPQFIEFERKKIEHTSYHIITWPVERALIRSGALPINTDDDYIQRMVMQLGRGGNQFEVETDNVTPNGTLKEELLKDRELMENEVWRIFEIETKAFQSWTSWHETLIELSEQGHLDRDRLLECSLEAMRREFTVTTLAGLAKFHEALLPSVAERKKLIPHYIAVFAIKHSQLVSMAVAAAETLFKAKQLDSEKFVAGCKPVFSLEQKGPAEKLLKLLGNIAKQEASKNQALRRHLASAAIAAIAHPSPEVQERGCNLLDQYVDELTDEDRERLRVSAEFASAATKARLAALMLKQATPAGSQNPAALQPPLVLQTTPPPSVDQADRLPPAIRRQAGVDEMLTAIASQTGPQVIAIRPKDVPRRNPANEIAPIADIDELIFCFSACLEKTDALELERIIDGIARFNSAKPADFSKRVAPLKKRLATLAKASHNFVQIASALDLLPIITDWLESDQSYLPTYSTRLIDYGASCFVVLRLKELQKRLLHKDMASLPLLCLPTHKDGWLDPTSLIERLKLYPEDLHTLPCQYDFAQALLRLTPDGRTDALARIDQLGATVRDRLRFALGGDCDFPHLAAGIEPDALALATAYARLAIDETAGTRIPFAMPSISLDQAGQLSAHGLIATDPIIPFQIDKLPDHAAHGVQRNIWSNEIHSGWVALTHPIDRKPLWLAEAVAKLPRYSTLKCLLDADLTLPPPAVLMLAWALGEDEPEVKTVVLDVLINAIAEMRLHPKELGKRLRTVLPNLKINRVGDILTETAKVSQLHQWAVFQIIDELLAAPDTNMANIHHLLAPFLESAAASGQVPSAAAKQTLAGSTGAKTAKLVKQLLALSENKAALFEISEAALASYIDRAQRWGIIANQQANKQLQLAGAS